MFVLIVKLISIVLRMARVKGITQFYLPSTRLSTMEGAILPLLSATEHRRTLAGTHFLSH